MTSGPVRNEVGSVFNGELFSRTETGFRQLFASVSGASFAGIKDGLFASGFDAKQREFAPLFRGCVFTFIIPLATLFFLSPSQRNRKFYLFLTRSRKAES